MLEILIGVSISGDWIGIWWFKTISASSIVSGESSGAATFAVHFGSGFRSSQSSEMQATTDNTTVAINNVLNVNVGI